MDEGAAHRVASAAAAQDPLLARDILAAVREYLSSTWGEHPEWSDYGTEGVARALRLQTFRDALVAHVGDETDEVVRAFTLRDPEFDHRGLTEEEARERVRQYVAEHGEEAARRDLEVLLMPEATGTEHVLGIERFLEQDRL